jgi:hypothetical protein
LYKKVVGVFVRLHNYFHYHTVQGWIYNVFNLLLSRVLLLLLNKAHFNCVT